MNVDDLKTSAFLRKEDVGKGMLVTIKKLTQENVAKAGAEPEHKAVLWFYETEKPLVLNSTNGKAIARITGHEMDIEHHWLGARIVLFVDPAVEFARRSVGGIRVRGPKPDAKLPPAPKPPAPGESEDATPPPQDDLPF